MKKFYLKSMGCKSNQFEGQIVAQELSKNGYSQVNDTKNANFYILNSCSVTHKSDNEALYLLRHAHSLGLKTVLTGCIAQIEKEKLLQEPYIDYVFGNQDKFNIANLIEADKKIAIKDLMSETNFYNITLDDTTKTRMSLKIQDGCDNRCSYCIIPFGRGKSRSANSDFIIDEINRYSQNGYKEVVLTGIHIGLWGKDFGKTLLDLLINIEKNTTINRYRLGSLNPFEINNEMLDFLQTSEKFCPHFHLSLQSACNKTLKNMNRHYSVEFYLDQIEDITKRFNKPFLGSDIIAGFAGETEEDFYTTVENLKKSKLSCIHTFPYSIRKGTVAEKMPNHLSNKIKEERANIIKQISKEKLSAFLNSNIGETQEVLIEKKKDKKTGLYKGLTRNYIKVLLQDGEFNSLKNITLKNLKGDLFVE